MSADQADFAVFGSSLLARLVAGLLAACHGRKVVFVGENQSGYRLPRGVDLSVGPITRPETWALLEEGVAETLRLIGKVAGRGASSYVDPILFSETAPGIEALSHVRHMAKGFRHAAEPVASSRIGSGKAGIVLRDAIRLNRGVLEPALDQWLDKNGVKRIGADRVVVTNNGAAQIADGHQTVEVSQAILADDDAIMAWLPLRQWPVLLRRERHASILTTRTRALAAPIMLDIGSSTILQQQTEGGIAAMGSGDLAAFSARMHALLGVERQTEQAGQTTFSALMTADGAPAFGRAAGIGADIIAGTSTYGAFLAPALARWLAGDAQPHQANWFGARLVSRNAKKAAIGDYTPLRPEHQT